MTDDFINWFEKIIKPEETDEEKLKKQYPGLFPDWDKEE